MLLLDQIRQKPQTAQALRLSACAVSACLIASAHIGGILIPLPTAFAAALPPLYALVILAGSLFTYFLSGSIAHAPMLICALVLAVLARWVLGERQSPLLAASIAGAGTLISVIMFGFAGLIHGGDWLLWGMAVLLTAGLAYCAAAVRNCCACGFPIRIRKSDGLFCAACYLALTAAFCSAQVFLLNIGQILIGLFVLSAAKRCHAVGGLLCGTLSACAMLLADGETVGLAAVLGLAGAAAGWFGKWQKGGVLAVYQAVCGMGLLLSDRSSAAVLAWVNGMIGGLLFLFLPVTQLADSLVELADTDRDLSALSGARMEFLSGSLAEVRSAAERIVNMLDTAEPLCPAEMPVCEGYAEGMEDADNPDGCLKSEQPTEDISLAKRKTALARADAAKLRDTRTLLFSQMQISEAVLRQSARKMQEEYHREQSRRVTDLLERFGIPVRAAAVRYTEGLRLTVELYLSVGRELEAETVTEYLQEMLQIPLECREVRVRKNEQRLILQSTGSYEVDTAAAQCAVCEDEPCGDCYDTFTDSAGNFYLVLSDGMGSGRDAAVDSKIVLTNLKLLVQSGMDCEDAAKIINAVMLTKSGDERFATLDIAKIDTDSAYVTIYKYGAGPTLVKHGDRVTVCQAATNPIGILPTAEPYTTTLKLAEGDHLFLLSDGLDEAIFPYIRQKLMDGERDLQSLVHAVCAKAQRDAKGAPPDDVTVLAAQISRPSAEN